MTKISIIATMLTLTKIKTSSINHDEPDELTVVIKRMYDAEVDDNDEERMSRKDMTMA